MVPMSFTKTEAHLLLTIAQTAIEQGLQLGKPLEVDPLDYPSTLREIRASFVTLKIQHTLRGCIGSITARLPLVNDVAYHAYAAAFMDTRFTPIQAKELPDLTLHISILNPAERMYFHSEAHLIQQLQPGIDGLVLEEGRHQGTFLPSVWESMASPTDFLHYLKKKAGLSMNYWSKTIKVYRYTVESIEPSIAE